MGKFIIKDKKSNKIVKEHNTYPNIVEGSKLIGFDYGKYDIYIVTEGKKPVYNQEQEYLKDDLIFIDDYYDQENYYNVKICQKSWNKVAYSKETIINKLNESLGNHLDNEYPLWERTKHAGEGSYILNSIINNTVTQEQLDRKSYIDKLYDWISECRIERDERENKYLIENIFPSFNWEFRPTK